jgi:hypothetical protein
MRFVGHRNATRRERNRLNFLGMGLIDAVTGVDPSRDAGVWLAEGGEAVCPGNNLLASQACWHAAGARRSPAHGTVR